MTFGEFKNLNYPDNLPMEAALISAMFKRQISMVEITNAYTAALEKERRLSYMKFEEACLNIGELLNMAELLKGGEDALVKAVKRAIHTINLSKTFTSNKINQKYGYVEDDERKWDAFCRTIYGTSKFEEEGK